MLGRELLGLIFALEIRHFEVPQDPTRLQPVLHVHLQLFQGLEVLVGLSGLDLVELGFNLCDTLSV